MKHELTSNSSQPWTGSFDERCNYCNKRVKRATAAGHDHDDATWDHVKPKSLLTIGEITEQVTACRQCNHMKGDTPPEVFREYIKLFGFSGLANVRAYRVYCHHLMIAGLGNVEPVIEHLIARWPSLRKD